MKIGSNKYQKNVIPAQHRSWHIPTLDNDSAMVGIKCQPTMGVNETQHVKGQWWEHYDYKC